jgi:hypothetical protein
MPVLYEEKYPTAAPGEIYQAAAFYGAGNNSVYETYPTGAFKGCK